MPESLPESVASPIIPKRRLIGVVAFQAALWLAVGIIIVVVGDSQIVLWLNPGDTMDESAVLYKILKLYSDTFFVVNLGSIVAALVAMCVPQWTKFRRQMLQVFFSLVVAAYLIEPLKAIVARPRPFQGGSPIKDQVNIFGETTDSGSMPSGHVGYTTAAVAPWALKVKSAVFSTVILLYAAGMMAIRVFLAVHYPTDVLVGNVIGIVAALAVSFAFGRLYSKVAMTYKKEWLLFAVGLVLFLLSFVFHL